MNQARLSVAVLFHRLGPYHFARLRAAGRLLPVVAIESSGADETYAWDKITGADGFDRITLFEKDDAQKQPSRLVAERLATALDKIRPTVVVVPGWADATALGALRWCVQNQVPSVIMSESTVWDEPRKVWKEWIKSQIVRLGSSALVGGTPHQDYLVQLGMPLNRVWLGYDAVDNEYFAQGAKAVRSQQDAFGRQHELPAKYFLASNRFVEKKNLPRLIQAYARYRERAEKSAAWNLVLLGDGALRSTLRSQIAALDLTAHVQLPGFKQYPDLPAFYAGAGAFVHASTTEQWGLVVNEAMASGLPVLVSNRCGCASDLVSEGVNGFTFDPCNVEQLAQLMLKISDFRFPISDFGNASQHIIAKWGPDRFATGLNAAVECALQVGSVKPTWRQRLILKAMLSR